MLKAVGLVYLVDTLYRPTTVIN